MKVDQSYFSMTTDLTEVLVEANPLEASFNPLEASFNPLEASSSPENAKCIICLEASRPNSPLMDQSEKFNQCQCKENLFHNICFGKYMTSNSNRCPTCRAIPLRTSHGRFFLFGLETARKPVFFICLLTHSAGYALIVALIVSGLIEAGGIYQMSTMLSTVTCSLLAIFGWQWIEFLCVWSMLYRRDQESLDSFNNKFRFFRIFIWIYRFAIAVCSMVIVSNHDVSSDTSLYDALFLQFTLELAQIVVDVWLMIILFIFTQCCSA